MMLAQGSAQKMAFDLDGVVYCCASDSLIVRCPRACWRRCRR